MPIRTRNTPSIGWPLLPLPDATGKLSWPELDTSIRQQIQVILTTRKGELLTRPRYGAGLQDFLQRSNNIDTRVAIRDAVREALQRHERRIEVNSIEVVSIDGQPDQLRIQIRYRILHTGATRRTGVTLNLST